MKNIFLALLLAFMSVQAIAQKRASETGYGTQNYLINGNFDLWQRGTSFSSTGSAVYTADRWYDVSNSGSTISRVAATGQNSQYALKLARNSGQTFTADLLVAQPFETANIVPLRGKRVTLSFSAKSGANFSGSGNMYVRLVVGTGTEGKKVGASFTSPTYPIFVTQPITSTMTRYALTSTVTIPASSTQMEVYFTFTPSGTAGADDSITIEQVMLNTGDRAAPFALAGGTVGEEKQLVRRYLIPIRGYFPLARVVNANELRFLMPSDMANMRTTPVVVNQGAAELGDWFVGLVSTSGSTSGYTVGSLYALGPELALTKTGHGVTGTTVFLRFDDKLFADAEL